MRLLHGARRRQGGALVRHAAVLAQGRAEGRDPRRARHAAKAAPRAGGLHRRAGGAVRLLHQRHDHGVGGFPRHQQEADRGADQAGAGEQSLPLRHACPHCQSRPARSRHRLREAPMNTHFKPSRRHVIKGGGALVVSFSLAPQMAGEALAQAAAAAKPLAPTEVDSYLTIDAKGAVTLYSGKVDLGTGVKTALAQMCAEELDVPFTRVSVVQGDTSLTPDQGTTWGSLSIQAGGIQIRQASAAAKSALLDEASKRLAVPKEHLSVSNGVITGL